MASAPPPFERVRMPTLLVLGAHSYLSYDHLLDAHRAALGDLLEVVTVDGGHTVLWDAFDETADAVESVPRTEPFWRFPELARRAPAAAGARQAGKGRRGGRRLVSPFTR